MGAAIARAFVAEGASVTVTGTKGQSADYDAFPDGVTYLPLRLDSHESIAEVAGSFDTLDILVNNAGMNLPEGRDEYEPETFDDVVVANLTGPYRLTFALHQALVDGRHHNGRSVVWISSLSTVLTNPFVPAYAAAKSGVGGALRTLAVNWGPSGIRVNAVAPGVVDTDMTVVMMTTEGLLRPTLDRTPLGRVAQPDDIAPPVLFLASSEARHITGQTLFVDGGYSVSG